ncbi:hypothetical protein RPMA_13790 [Tardiphaga alba]|uniref:Uncharacterized protein n=1 Tax=Tardiphaga alba TaxID=340268 RepID=A0ABX8ABM3_9BRAD|nr:hypothetical protein [Tardiphaga alba]QUS39790.1 hypothetical protein RPMA_13790 [Tardiphaga alba]
MTQQPRLTPTAPQYAPLFTFGLLTAASALASFAFACATPFSAFAVIAAAILPLRSAFLVVTGAWLVNQIIGYSALHYPINANSLSWGIVLGLASLAATAAAKNVLNASARLTTPVALAIALAVAYTVYEITLFAFTPALGGTEGFAMDIVARIGALSALWLAGMVAACEIFRLLASAGQQRTP